MEDTKATSEGSVNPAENPDKWLNKWDAERASKSAEADQAPSVEPASPAEPTVAEKPVAAQPTSWREVVIGEDVDHGFFRGKKVEQAIESYKHAERAKQEAERRAAELERQLIAYQQQKQQASQPQPDADEEINRLWFENPTLAARKLQERAVLEAERAFEQKWSAKTQEQEVNTTFQQGMQAASDTLAELKVDPVLFEDRLPLVLLHLTNPQSRFYGDGQGIRRKDAMVKVYKELFGDPAPKTEVAPIVVKAPAPEPPPPPGSRKAAPANITTDHASPLRREQSEAYREFAKAAGVDPEKLTQRARERNKEKARG